MLTPRPYLSYSQFSLVNSNPQAYIDKYIYGKETPINSGQQLGKEVADFLETGELTGDIMKDLSFMNLSFERLAVKDKEEIVNVYDIPILIKPDERSEDWTKLIEVKTGPESAWNINKANKSEQIDRAWTKIH